jgi:crotonobetainyl-CoA:carnitine CoA-transferase CaiB-like acyl-CoA transferase
VTGAAPATEAGALVELRVVECGDGVAAAYAAKLLADLGADVVKVEHPEVGVRRHLGIPWRMSGTPCVVERPAPCLGEATDYVLGDIRGLDADTRADLRTRGVVA